MPACEEPTQSMQELHVDEVRSMEVSIARDPLDQLRVGVVGDEQLKCRRRVQDEHRLGVAIAAAAHGGDEVRGRRAAGAGGGATQYVADLRAAGHALELAERVVRERHARERRSRPQRAVYLIGHVAVK